MAGALRRLRGSALLIAIYFFLNFLMIKANATSRAEHTPRSPNADELRLLGDWLIDQGCDEFSAQELPACGYIAVFDHYVTGSPGYVGKVLSVIWDGSPSTYDVFVWKDGKMEHCRHEFDSRE